jgi:DNA-directed RNA polymerase subunit beta'
MLSSHNILNPANGAPIAVPSQDMVLGLYYITKLRTSTKDHIVKGEGLTFYSPEEVMIAHEEGQLDLHAALKVRIEDYTGPEMVTKIIETTCGRVIFNEMVPREVGYINEVLTKKSLRNIIGRIINIVGMDVTAKFLDDIKGLGYISAFKGGLSFNLDDIIIPKEKEELVVKAKAEVDEVIANYNMGLITNNERYNQIIDIWTHTNSRLTKVLMDQLENDKQGFNSIYMMFDSGARGSKEQIRQLSGMRGLMAKPKKSSAAGGQEIIENPILANFKEGLSILEYFISTHGARKGLADTALKTADAGYLTRRLVDVAQDVVIKTQDCFTLRGIETTALKNNEDIIESLEDRIIGRTTVFDIKDPISGEMITEAGEEIDMFMAEKIDSSGIEQVEIRSVLTCDLKQGVCAKCYGQSLSTGRTARIGETVGVIAAQSIGEPGTQLTLRTFHVGGTASNIADVNSITAKFDGKLEIDGLRTVVKEDGKDSKVIVVSRLTEMKIIEPDTGVILMTNNIPYGSEKVIWFVNGIRTML